MIVLGLSTSTRLGSAALYGTSGLASIRTYDTVDRHGERLVGLVDELVRSEGLLRTSIGAVACDVGPGSFTGVRVALAAAHGIALALGVPLVGVGSLESMAAPMGNAPSTEEVVAFLDARKNELFCGSFRGGFATAPLEHLPIPLAVQRLRLAADKGAKLVGEIPPEAAASFESLSIDAKLPDALTVARLGAKRLEDGFDRPVEPLYVRAPDARTTAELAARRASSGA
jgi:tRNA threonylcarbamoyladenosine biosynthesis protein TsaB